jgi:hypothetical protein
MDELLETIDWLQDLSDSNRLPLFEASYNFLQGTLDKNTLSTLSDSYEKTPESLEGTFEALGFIITSLCTAKSLPEIPWISELQTFIQEKQAEIKLAYSKNSLHNPLLSNFKEFDWRLEVQLSSRALEDIVVPKILMQFKTDSEERLLECDYANLKNLYSQLKNALKSFESVRAKKAEKFLKPNKNI